MKKLLAIIVLGLLSFNITEAGTNNEGKNKKYVYKYLNDLKTIIKNDDPTDFKELKFLKTILQLTYYITLLEKFWEIM